MSQFIYPPSPADIDVLKLKPSAAFTAQVWKVLFSIFLFFVVYLLLIALSVGLAIACVYGCVAIIAARPGTITIMLGLGLLVLGIAVFAFLIKFMFAVNREGNPKKIEVTPQSEPGLFEFIKRLTEETKTPFPKKIFISPDVNACVFYHSNFWSMFLPIRKNLEIGVGLVNSINLSEFKAVMAHEFGHFSQRSMKLGSFTYNVNKVIYNMLYQNTGYSNFLSKWGSTSGYFAIFAHITAGIAQGIQSILKEVYKLINKNYYALSREMEFHADAIAASVAGGNNLVTALNRIEISAACFDTTLNHADEWLKAKQHTANLFSHHATVFQAFAQNHKLRLVEDLPEITSTVMNSFSKSRINFKNQWASHPELKERTAHLEALEMDVPAVEKPAWAVFSDPLQMQHDLTSLVYGELTTNVQSEEKDSGFFSNWYQQEIQQDKLPAFYNGYYDGRLPQLQDWDMESLAGTYSANTPAQLFTAATAKLDGDKKYLDADVATLKAISAGEIQLKSFDFDGNKMPASAAEELATKLEAEATKKSDFLQENDKDAFVYFNGLNRNDGRLKAAYLQMQETEKRSAEFVALANSILQKLQPFYQGAVQIQFILDSIQGLKANEEKQLKALLKDLISEGMIDATTKTNMLETANHFAERDYAYFSNETFHDNELQELNQIIFGLEKTFLDYRWKLLKTALELQLEYLHAYKGETDKVA